MRQKTICALATVITMLGVSLNAIAEPSAEDAADYRIAVMTTLRGHLVAASYIVRGLVANDGYLVKHAQGVQNSLAELHRVFQKGSNVGESKALPVIWQDPEKFAAAVRKGEEASVAFTKAAQSGDTEAIGGAFRNLGSSCRGCHDNFRLSDD